MTLISGRLSSLRTAKSVVVLPEPVGPVTRSAPVGLLTISRSSACMASVKPSCAIVGGRVDWSSSRRTTDSPYTVGSVTTRTSSFASRGRRVHRDASVLRLAPLGDVELREHLEARDDARRPSAAEPAAPRAGSRRCGSARRAQSSCGSKWMSERSVLRRLEEDRVDEPHERLVGQAVVGLEVGPREQTLSNSSSVLRGRSGRAPWRSRRAPCGRSGRRSRRAWRPRARAGAASRAAARRCPARLPGRRPRSAERRRRARTGSRRRARARASELSSRRASSTGVVEEVDERQPELSGVTARDPVARRDPFVDEGAREGARLARAFAGERELVGQERASSLRSGRRRGRPSRRRRTASRRRCRPSRRRRSASAGGLSGGQSYAAGFTLLSLYRGIGISRGER